MEIMYGIAIGWVLGVFSYAVYQCRPRQNTKEGTPSASHNSDLMPLLSDCRDVIHQLRPKDFGFYMENSEMFRNVIGRLNAVLSQQH